MSSESHHSNPSSTNDESLATDVQNVCQRCGAHVSETFRRVCGDNDDNVFACPQCSPLDTVTQRAGGRR